MHIDEAGDDDEAGRVDDGAAFAGLEPAPEARDAAAGDENVEAAVEAGRGVEDAPAADEEFHGAQTSRTGSVIRTSSPVSASESRTRILSRREVGKTLPT